MTEKPKLRVGVYSITGCAGCQLSIIFNEEELLPLLDLIELHAFPFIKEVNATENLDYILMEGLVATPEDLQVLTAARARAKKLVALGACAHSGCIPAYRTFTLQAAYAQTFAHDFVQLDENIRSIEPTPISAHVPVDYTIPGCPPSKAEILAFLWDIAAGLEPKPVTTPVCVECRRNGTRCLLEDGKPCLGPVTRGGCAAVCTTGGLECWGCRGMTEDANMKVLYAYLRGRGYSRPWIEERIRTFVGKTLPADLTGLFEGTEQPVSRSIPLTLSPQPPPSPPHGQDH